MTSNETSNKPAPKPKYLRLYVVLLGVVFVLGIFVVVVWTQFRIPERNLEAELAAIRELGQPLTIEELENWYPHVPDDQNFAHIVMTSYREFEPQYRSGDRPERYYVPWNDMPLQQVPNEYAYYLDRFDHLINPLIEHARAADFDPDARYSVDFENLIHEEQYHLLWLRSLARQSVMRAERAAVSGNFSGMIDHYKLILALRRSLNEEPHMLAQLTGTILDAIVVSSLSRVLNAVDLDAETLLQLRTGLQPRNLRRAYARGIAGDRVLFLDVMDTYIRASSPLNKERAQRSGRPSGLATQSKIYLRWLYLSDCNEFLDTFKDACTAEELSWTLFRGMSAKVKESATGFRFSEPITSTLGDSLANASEAFLRAEARYRVAEVSLAVQEYCERNGALPVSTDVLSPEYMAEVPRDPYTDRPLGYKRLDNGFVVYSVGPDESDNSADWLESRVEPKDSGDWYLLVERPDLAQPEQ